MIFDIEKDTECLMYQMTEDPNQFRNLYSSLAHVTQRLELKRELLAFLSRRIFGPYTHFDIERLERGFNPNDPMLPPLVDQQSIGVCFLRAGAMVTEPGKHDLFVPFYPQGKLMLWGPQEHPRSFYRTYDQALPFDSPLAERLLDIALRQTMSMIPTVSLKLKREPVNEPISSSEEAQALIRGGYTKSQSN